MYRWLLILASDLDRIQTLSYALYWNAGENIWAKLFKINDVVIERDAKISYILWTKMVPLFAKKKGKELLQFFSKNTATIDFVSTVRLKKSLTYDVVKLRILKTDVAWS